MSKNRTENHVSTTLPFSRGTKLQFYKNTTGAWEQKVVALIRQHVVIGPFRSTMIGQPQHPTASKHCVLSGHRQPSVTLYCYRNQKSSDVRPFQSTVGIKKYQSIKVLLEIKSEICKIVRSSELLWKRNNIWIRLNIYKCQTSETLHYPIVTWMVSKLLAVYI